MSTTKKPALGRGLSALLENHKTDITTKQLGENAPIVGSVSMIKIKKWICTGIKTEKNLRVCISFIPRNHKLKLF